MRSSKIGDTMMTKLEQAKLLLDFYFAPWGAAKGEIWEDISNDHPFTDDSIMRILIGISEGSLALSEKDIRMMKIVTG